MDTRNSTPEGAAGGAEAAGAGTGAGPRPGTWYLLAFAVYGAVYVVVLLTSGQVAGLVALIGGIGNVLPQALLGLAVPALCRRAPLPKTRHLAFFARHAALATAYAVLCTAATTVIFMVHRSIHDGAWKLSVNSQILAWQAFQGTLVYAILASVSYSITTVARLRAEEARAAHAAELRVRAELRALEAQINPHFLFNTLHTLLALVRRSPQAAEEAIEQFGELMHHVLRAGQSDRPELPLAEEWEFVRNYLALEKLRLGDRLEVVAEATPAALSCLVPPLTLQPLIENAVRHGIAPRAAGGTLVLKAAVTDGVLHLEVRDDGAGASAEVLEKSRGLGLRLVRERLLALHGGAASLDVETAPGGGFAARVRLPARGAATTEPQ